MEQFLERTLDRKEIVHHKDENKKNNNIDNLEVMTLSEHTSKHMTGRRPSKETIEKLRNTPRQRGSQRKFAKLTELMVLCIKELLINGYGVRELGLLFEINHKTISKIKNNTAWKHVTLNTYPN